MAETSRPVTWPRSKPIKPQIWSGVAAVATYLLAGLLPIGIGITLILELGTLGDITGGVLIAVGWLIWEVL